jgi:hypothetical protein
MSNNTFQPDVLATLQGKHYQIDYKLFDKILKNNDFTKCNALEAMKKMYEIMFVYYNLRVWELKLERDDLVKKVSNEYADVLKLREELAVCNATILELKERLNLNQESNEVKPASSDS